MDPIGSGRPAVPPVHPLALIVSLIVAAGLLVIVLPVMLVAGLIGLAVLGALWAWFAFRVWMARAKAPNGALDGRKNVRVRTPGDRATVDAQPPPDA